MTALLEATGVVKRFGDTAALDGFDLAVEAGEIAGLVGHNGAGKSTFARVTAGLVTPDAGTVRVDGMNASRAADRVRPILGLAPQELALYPTATGRQLWHMIGITEMPGIDDFGPDETFTTANAVTILNWARRTLTGSLTSRICANCLPTFRKMPRTSVRATATSRSAPSAPCSALCSCLRTRAVQSSSVSRRSILMT